MKIVIEYSRVDSLKRVNGGCFKTLHRDKRRQEILFIPRDEADKTQLIFLSARSGIPFEQHYDHKTDKWTECIRLRAVDNDLVNLIT